MAGKGMAPAAALAHLLGNSVTGDDLKANHRIPILRAAGIPIEVGRNTTGPAGTEVLVSTAAMRRPVPAGATLLSRLQFVGSLLETHNYAQICVCGSFGKSSAASILLSTLAAVEPASYIGADVPGTLCGASRGSGSLAVVEACEYRDEYLALRPWAAIILNTFSNHEDWFGSGTDRFATSLREFLTRNTSHLEHVVLGDQVDPSALRGTSLEPYAHTVGFATSCRWQIQVQDRSTTMSTFSLKQRGERSAIGPFTIPVPGASALRAGAIAAVAALLCDVRTHDIADGLRLASLPSRRFEVLHDDDRLTLIDDNARHEAQVAALMSAIRQRFGTRPVCVVLDPWGRKNPRDLGGWADALGTADCVVILPVAACSTLQGGAERPDAAEALQGLLASRGVRAHSTANPSEASHAVNALLGEGEHWVVATVGYDASSEQFRHIHDEIGRPS